MHFALINWITASLPSHANLLGRLFVPDTLPSYLFVSPFLSYFLFSLKFFRFTLLSFVAPNRPSSFFLHVPHSFFRLIINYSFRFTHIGYSFLHAQLSLSSCIIYGFAVHHYMLVYYLLVYYINQEWSPSSPSPSNSTWRTWLYSLGSCSVPRLSEIAHREHILSSKPIDQRRWSDPYLFWNVFSHIALPLITFAQDIFISPGYKNVYIYISFHL